MNKIVKWGLIIFVGLPAVCGISSILFLPKDQSTAKPAVQTEQTQQPAVKAEQKKEEDSYYVLSKQVLKELYTKKAKAAGTGVPDIDARFATYKDWDADDTLKVSQGTFYLAGNDKIEHSYTMRWRKKNQQIIRVEIDGQKVYYDAEEQQAAFDDDKKK